MNDDKDLYYEDLDAPDGGMGDLKEIKRIKGMSKHAPPISWGEEYRGWPIEQRLEYAEKLASAMNHAASVLQDERNKLIEVVKKQEEQLKHNANAYLSQGNLMHKELGSADVEKQQLYQEIVNLKQKTRVLAKRVKELEAEKETKKE